MSFLNGIPLPDASDPAFGVGVNKILQYEQRNVMDRVFQGEITDDKPKSVYATLLTGENVYPQYHPLLRSGTDAEYAAMPTDTNPLSLMIPQKQNLVKTKDVDAFFVIEAVVDIDSTEGINTAKAFLDLIQTAPEKWRDDKNVSVAFRLVIEKAGVKGDLAKGGGIASLFCSASRLRPEVLRRAIEIIVDARSFLGAFNDFTTIEDFDKESKDTLSDITKYAAKCRNKGTSDLKNYYTANGRIYSPIEGPLGPFLTIDDIQMLVNVELDRAVGMAKLVVPKLLPKDEQLSANAEKTLAFHDAIALSTTALNYMFSKSESSELLQFSQTASSGIVETMESLETAEKQNPLFFSWNNELVKNKLQVSTAVLYVMSWTQHHSSIIRLTSGGSVSNS